MRGTLFLQLFCLLVSVSSQQACDTSSNSAQCSDGEICRSNICETATPCDYGNVCAGTPGTVCVTDYCQPHSCTATGQCVHGQNCSQNTGQCVYPVFLRAEENTHVILEFSEVATVGTYEEIAWYKGGRGSDDRIVFFNDVLTEDSFYFEDGSGSGSSPCKTCDKGELNVTTGTFTIYNVQLSDDDYYYYRFDTGGGTFNTGTKYEIKLEVYVSPRQDEMSIEGISDIIEEVGTELDLTCTINRIKPEAAEMYWVVNGRKENGLIMNGKNDDGSFQQTNALEYTVAKEDEGKPMKCVVIPVYGKQREVEQIVNPSMFTDSSEDTADGVSMTIIGGAAGGSPVLVVIVIVVVVLYRKYKFRVSKKETASQLTAKTKGPETTERSSAAYADVYNPIPNLQHEYSTINEEQFDDGYLKPVTNQHVYADEYANVYDHVERPSQRVASGRGRGHEYSTINEEQFDDGYLEPGTNQHVYADEYADVYDHVEGPSQGVAGGRGIRG